LAEHLDSAAQRVEVAHLVDVPLGVVSTGGAERHQLVTEHQLRPLFSFL